MRRSRSILAGILLVGCFLPMSATVETAPGRGGRRAPVDLRIATGQRGGVYVAYGEGLAGVLRDHLPWARPRVLTTGASLDNLGLLASRRADLAFALSDSAAAAAWGRPPFTAPQPIRAIARLYDNYLHLVVRADAGIDSLPELRGRVIALGALGSGTELTASRLLLAAGIDPRRDLTVRRDSLEASAEAVRRREIDGFFFSGGLPTTTVRSWPRKAGSGSSTCVCTRPRWCTTTATSTSSGRSRRPPTGCRRPERWAPRTT